MLLLFYSYRGIFTSMSLLRKIYLEISIKLYLAHLVRFYFLFFFFVFLGLYPWHIGSSQARGPIGAVAASLRHSHSNMGSKLRLWPTPQLMEIPGSLTHWAKPGVKLTSSWILVGFLTCWATARALFNPCLNEPSGGYWTPPFPWDSLPT